LLRNLMCSNSEYFTWKNYVWVGVGAGVGLASVVTPDLRLSSSFWISANADSSELGVLGVLGVPPTG